MTIRGIYTMLTQTGLPVAYNAFPQASAPDPPFMVYTFPGSADVMADDTNYVRANELNVELYTDEKDPATEALVERALLSNGLPFTRYETWIEGERLFQVTFETEVIINGE